MPFAERAYTFRAADDLGDRIREASVILDETADAAGSDVGERIARELVLSLARDSARFRGVKGNQSAFVREAVELVVNAVQKVASDLHYASAYAEAAALRSDEERDFRRAARSKVASRRRDT